MSFLTADAAVYAPHNERPVKLTSTGTTEKSNAVALVGGRYATIKVGAAIVCVRFAGVAAGTTMVDATLDLKLNSWSSFDWVVQPGKTDFVYVEAADGASTYEAWVWTSSPPV